MKVNLGIWEALTRLIVFLLIGAAIVGALALYLPVLRKTEFWYGQKAREEANVQALLAESNRLKSEINAFDNPRAVERFAREQLKYARTGEVILRFEEPATNPVARPTPAPGSRGAER